MDSSFEWKIYNSSCFVFWSCSSFSGRFSTFFLFLTSLFSGLPCFELVSILWKPRKLVIFCRLVWLEINSSHVGIASNSTAELHQEYDIRLRWLGGGSKVGRGEVEPTDELMSKTGQLCSMNCASYYDRSRLALLEGRTSLLRHALRFCARALYWDERCGDLSSSHFFLHSAWPQTIIQPNISPLYHLNMYCI